MSSWEQSCRVQKVRQEHVYGCGAACVAMLSGKPYEDVVQLFREHGIGTRKNKPLATNFAELVRALALLGVSAKRTPWRGWDAVDGPAIVAVESPTADWHWVVAERHPEFGIIIHDPDFALPSFSQKRPPGVKSHPFAKYQPRKSWIRVAVS